MLNMSNLLSLNNKAGYDDNLRIIKSWTEYTDDRKTLKYIMYELEIKNTDGTVEHIYKALKFTRIVRLPKSSKQSSMFMDVQARLLTSVWERNIKFITIIANMICPVPLGLLFLYGVQGVATTEEDAKYIADQDFVSLSSVLQGSYRVLEQRILTHDESEWLKEKMFSMKNCTIVRGIPKPKEGGVLCSSNGFGTQTINPKGQDTIEKFIAGMSDKEYIIQVLSTPVKSESLERWLGSTSKQMTLWNSKLKGNSSINFSLSIPMMFMGNIATSTGWNHAYTAAESLTTTASVSESMNFSTSIGESINQSFGQSVGHSAGESYNSSIGNSYSTGFGSSSGTSWGQSSGLNQGTNEGFNSNANHGNTYGENLNASTANNQSITNSHTNGVNASHGISHTDTETNATSQGITNTTGSSQGSTLTNGWTETKTSGLSNSTSKTVTDGSSVNQVITDNDAYGRSSTLTNSNSNQHSSQTTNSFNFGGGTSAGTTHTDNSSLASPDGYNVGLKASLAGVSLGGGAGETNSKGDMSYTDSTSVQNGQNWGNTIGSSNGWSTGNSSSNASGATENHSTGSSYATGTTHSEGTTSGVSVNESYAQGVSGSASQSQTVSNSQGLSNTISNSNGVSNGTTDSTGSNSSYAQGYGYGTSQSTGSGESWGQSTSNSQGQSIGNNTSASNSNNVGGSSGVSTSDSWGLSNSKSYGQTSSNSYTQSATSGTGKTYSQNDGNGASNGWSTSSGNNTSNSYSQSGNMSNGTSATMGFGPHIGYVKSYQWQDKEVQNILDLLQFQNDRLMQALKGNGAFFTDVYIATENEQALSAAQIVAKATWNNDEASVCPLQVMDLTREEQNNLLYHFSAFSADNTKERIDCSIESYRYSTILLASEFTAYTHLPRISEGGIYADVMDIPKFAVPSMKSGEIYMGKILSGERWTPDYQNETIFEYRLSEQELMHGIFTGESRSGKTVAATRFITELTKVKRSKTGKRLRIVALDPKQDWRILAKFVEPERFHFYSLGNPEFLPINLNICKVPKNVNPQVWVDGIIEIFCRSYGLLERGKALLAETFYSLYDDAGVFEDSPDWRKFVPERSSKVTLQKVFERMHAIKLSLDDPHNKRGIMGTEAMDAYSCILDRLQVFGRKFSIENRLFSQQDGISVDELIGKDDVIVLESYGLETTFKNFIFGCITSGFFKYAQAHEGGFLAPDQYETVLVIEEANEVLTGSDTAGGKGGGMELNGQSEFEKILDQAAGLGLFVFSITQKIADMPSSCVANAGLLFAGKISRADDVELTIRKVGREGRYSDRDFLKWFPRSPIGWFVCRSSRNYDFKDTEPVLVKIDPLGVEPPSNAELKLALAKKKALELLNS